MTGGNLFDVYDLSSTHVPFANVNGAGFMICTEAGHQGAITMSWPHFLGALMSPIFIGQTDQSVNFEDLTILKRDRP